MRSVLGLAGVTVVFVVWVACGGGESKKAPPDATPRPPDATPECKVALGGKIEADQTIARGCKVSVDTDVVIAKGTLTIERGVVVSFADGRSMSVGGAGDEGRLVIAGSSDEPVVFGSASGKAPGAWGQLRLHDRAGGSAIAGLVLEHAGKDGVAAILVGASDVSITDSTVRDVGGVAVELAPKVRLGKFSGNTIGATGKEALRADPDGLGSLGAGNQVTGESVIAVVPGTLTRSVTWRDHGAPYLVTDEVVIEMPDARATLTLDAGVEVRFGVKAAMWVGKKQNGGLKIAGTEAAPVVLTSADGNPGAWNLWIGPKGEAVIEGATIQLGGLDHDAGALAVRGGSLEVYRTTFRDNVVALSVDPAGKLHAVDRCTFAENSLFAIAVHTQLGALGDNDYDDASKIELRGGVITEPVTWKPQVDVWWSGKVLVEGGVLTIEAGTEFTMVDQGAELRVASVYPKAGGSKKKKKGKKAEGPPPAPPSPTRKAQLTIRGLPDRPVKLMGVRDTAGTWGNIVLTGEQDSSIEHLVLSGTGGDAAIVVENHATLEVEDVTCSACAGAVVTHSCDARVTVAQVVGKGGTPVDYLLPTCAPATP